MCEKKRWRGEKDREKECVYEKDRAMYKKRGRQKEIERRQRKSHKKLLPLKPICSPGNPSFIWLQPLVYWQSCGWT